MIKIDKDIPVVKNKFPFERMEVGDSFLAGKYTTDLQRNINSLSFYYSKKLNVKFESHKTDEGLRVWRIR